ncbi:efflux RND transporter periplasmic adaptor subunit [Herbiconiux daphne]|uniref:Peptidoglycan binding-like domain-containing protein n=1 Tax=Herbiconiux daphne TaxID=2970914 RepID=A0ABT2H0F8_9MICO|nr:hypothetical protein [Herbiconiux daphne]MCS5733375.1 hypothetical protein [Herbiconiux daphne]
MRSSRNTARGDRSPGRWWRGPRLVALVAGIAVASLLCGIVLSRFVVSPAELAARAKPPSAGPVTAPIEERVIENTVTTRADVVYADAVDVKVDSTGLAGPAVVTGHLPEVGTMLTAGSVALEVAGRPLIVLPGDLPAYRSLHVGLSGPDVLQLKAALASLAIDVGDTSSDVFDAATAAALDALYRAAGYPSPAASPDAEERLDSARKAVRSAQLSVDQATSALGAAEAPPTEAEQVEADNAVREAQRQLDLASAAADPAQIERCRDELNLAVARRDEVLAPGPAPEERAGLDSAEAQLTDAEDALTRAQNDALTVLPAGEVVYLSSLPRRVDSVAAERGVVPQGAAMSVSGADLILAGTASEADAALLTEGMPATFTSSGGGTYTATVASITAKKSDPSDAPAGSDPQKHFEVRLKPQSLDDAAVESLKGSNVKVSIPVQSTSGAVLSVPIAALTAGPGGESRIEIVPDDGAARRADATDSDTTTGTSLVTVTAGLSAGGFVEVKSDDPRVRAGAKVVVGR